MNIKVADFTVSEKSINIRSSLRRDNSFDYITNKYEIICFYSIYRRLGNKKGYLWKLFLKIYFLKVTDSHFVN